MDKEQGRWLDSMHFARTRINGCLEACKDENKRLSEESKTLQSLCKQEISNGDNSLGTRQKKRSTFVRDLVYELDCRKESLEDLLLEYDEILGLSHTCMLSLYMYPLAVSRSYISCSIYPFVL